MTPKCQYCDIQGDGVQYPIFPMSDATFGKICAECDDERVAELAKRGNWRSNEPSARHR